MASTFALRQQIEAALSSRIPSALTPAARILRPLASAGIPAIDELLEGGLPLGAITEIVGPECSGRTSLALSFLSRMVQTGKVCAWIDVSNTLHPESAAAAGIDLSWLLWVRCGVPATKTERASTIGFALPEKYLIPPPIKKGLHGGGFGSHPRNEVRGLSDAVSGFLKLEATAPRCAEPLRRIKPEPEDSEPTLHNNRPIKESRLSPVNPGRALNRHCGRQTCCCKQAASVRSCWIWAALRLSMLPGFRWRHGFVIARPQRKTRQASFY